MIQAMSTLLGSSLGMTCLMSLLAKASKSSPVPSNPVWASLANTIITAAMEGAAIGPAMVNIKTCLMLGRSHVFLLQVSLDIGEGSLDSLLNLSEPQRKV